MMTQPFEIKYSDKIQVNTFNLEDLFYEDQLPLKFQFKRQINEKILWEVELNSNSWATFPDTEMIDVIVVDQQNNTIYTQKWNVVINGSKIYKVLWNYCLTNPNSKGIVVGTHDGEFGEWVPVATDRLSEMTLVEASGFQFQELTKNYESYKNLKFINQLITKDGKDTVFYEGGRGYTNTVLKRVIEYWEKEPISETIRKSIKFSELITPDINWIHTDVEGIDIELIMSLSDEQLGHLDVIIYEYNNSDPNDRKLIKDFLNQKGFVNYTEKGVGMGVKK